MIAQLAARHYPLWLIRVLRIALFIVLMALAAKMRIAIPNTTIPITLQTVIVFIAGMTLGPVEGAISMIGYVGAIAANQPIDARGMGVAVFAGDTAGYLIGFIPGAFIAGLTWRTNERYRLLLSILCGLLAAAAILVCGTLWLAQFYRISWGEAVLRGLFPFALIEPGKVLLAASLVKLGRESWLRWLAPHSTPGEN
jgi:biotin transport system substrate-specific component